MKKLVVEYNSNNSGGSWWLTRENWLALESEGWKLKRGEYVYDNHEYVFDGNGMPVFREEEGYSYMGAITDVAWKRFDTITEALREFEGITGLDVTDEGCNCCGAPHSFEWWEADRAESGKRVDTEQAHGTSLLTCLYPNKSIPSTLREAIENS